MCRENDIREKKNTSGFVVIGVIGNELNPEWMFKSMLFYFNSFSGSRDGNTRGQTAASRHARDQGCSGQRNKHFLWGETQDIRGEPSSPSRFVDSFFDSSKAWTETLPHWTAHWINCSLLHHQRFFYERVINLQFFL